MPINGPKPTDVEYSSLSVSPADISVPEPRETSVAFPEKSAKPPYILPITTSAPPFETLKSNGEIKLGVALLEPANCDIYSDITTLTTILARIGFRST